VQKLGPYSSTEKRCYEYCQPTANTSIIPTKWTYFCDYSTVGSPLGTAYQQMASTPMSLSISISDYNDPPYIVGTYGVQGLPIIPIGDSGTPNVPSCIVNGSVNVVKQNSPQVAVVSMQATDQDVTYAHAPFTFVRTNPADSIWNWFDLDNVSGEISITPTVNASNMNTNKFLTIGQIFSGSVTVMDAYPWTPSAPRGSSSCMVYVTVGQNFSQPVFPNPPFTTVLESTPLGTVVYTSLVTSLSAVDPDVNNNPPDALTFTMGNSPWFIIDPASSELTTANSILDYESLYSSNFTVVLTVRVQNLEGASAVAQVTIYVTDKNEAPICSPASALASVLEDSLASTPVLNVGTICIDPDIYANGVTVFKNTSFSIISGCLGSSCPFNISSKTGLLQVTYPTPGKLFFKKKKALSQN